MLYGWVVLHGPTALPRNEVGGARVGLASLKANRNRESVKCFQAVQLNPPQL